MGGQAFTSGGAPLLTPRMPLEIYNLMQERIKSLLSSHFEHIGVPIEAPGKTSYGDIDILVANPTSDLPEPKIETLAKILGATKWISAKPVMNFALPYPEHPGVEVNDVNGTCSLNGYECREGLGMEVEEGLENGGEGESEELHPDRQTSKKRKLVEKKPGVEKFVQVDIHICDDLPQFRWEIFHQDHGDLWNILGSLIRNQGLTINDKGLHIRIPDLEAVNRKRSMILLSSDPDLVLGFLGLDKDRWSSVFGSVEEMFEYATTCRFFYVRVEQPEREGEEEYDKAVIEHKKQLKANDRKRLNHRPVFKQWIEEYIPELRRKGLFLGEPISREKVTELAFETFGGGVKAEFDSKLAEWKQERERIVVLEAIKKGVPMPAVSEDSPQCVRDCQYRSAAIKGLKAIILDGSTEDGIPLEDGMLSADGLYDMDKVESFVERRWRTVGDIRWIAHEKKAAEGMKKKMEKQRMEANAEQGK